MSSVPRKDVGKGKMKKRKAENNGDAPKKAQRGSRACTVCRRLKMRCTGAENGGPCDRCRAGSHECIFEESQRGRRAKRKGGTVNTAFAKSLKKMESTLQSVLSTLSPEGSLPPAAASAVVAAAAQYAGVTTYEPGNLPFPMPNLSPSQNAVLMNALEGTSRIEGRPEHKQEVHGLSYLQPMPEPRGRVPLYGPTNMNTNLKGSTAGTGPGSGLAGPTGAIPGTLPRSGLSSVSPEYYVYGQPHGAGAGGSNQGTPVVPNSGPLVDNGKVMNGNNGLGNGLGPGLGGGPGGVPAPGSTNGNNGVPQIAPFPKNLGDPLSMGGNAPLGNVNAPFVNSNAGAPPDAGNLALRRQKVKFVDELKTKLDAASKGSGGNSEGYVQVPALSSLPDNTLNPLGLMAEAVQLNRRGESRPSSAGNSPHAPLLDFNARPFRSFSDTADRPPQALEELRKTLLNKRLLNQDGSLPAGPGNSYKAEDTSGSASKKRLGPANKGYFHPKYTSLPFPMRRSAAEGRGVPSLIRKGVLTHNDAEQLFTIFFTRFAHHAPFLDPRLYTASATAQRSPFLFNCICAIASLEAGPDIGNASVLSETPSEFSDKKLSLYTRCLIEAKESAFDLMARGQKSVEIVQGFILISLWNQPTERFEQDRTWMFSGLAIRMATELNLSRPLPLQRPVGFSASNTPTPLVEPNAESYFSKSISRPSYEREVLNRERTWIMVFIIDRAISAATGRPYSICREDSLLRNAKSWWSKSVENLPSDYFLTSIVELHRITSRSLDVLYSDPTTPSGLNSSIHYPTVMRGILDQLDQWYVDWRVEPEHLPHLAVTRPDLYELLNRDPLMPQEDFKLQTMSTFFYYNYYRLFFLSFAVQNSRDTTRSAQVDIDTYVRMAVENASRIVSMLRSMPNMPQFLCSAVDSTFIYLSHVAMFLLKIVHPSFMHLVDIQEIFNLVTGIADSFEACALHEHHTPALYASFLRMLLDNKSARTRPSSLGNTVPNTPNMRPAPLPEENANTQAQNAHDGNAALSDFMSSVGTWPLATAPVFEMNANSNLGESFNIIGDHFNLPGITSGGSGLDNFNLDSSNMEDILSRAGFWDNMLMPGYNDSFPMLSAGGSQAYNPTDFLALDKFDDSEDEPRTDDK